MKRPIRFLPEAKAEFDEAADRYEWHQSGLGVEFVRRVRAVLVRVAANPRFYATVYQDVRKAAIKRFPFVVLYREELGEVLVISVFHTSRDTSVWQSRA